MGIMLCILVDLVAVERPAHRLAWRNVYAEGNTAMLARIRAATGGSLLPRAVPVRLAAHLRIYAWRLARSGLDRRLRN